MPACLQPMTTLYTLLVLTLTHFPMPATAMSVPQKSREIKFWGAAAGYCCKGWRVPFLWSQVVDQKTRWGQQVIYTAQRQCFHFLRCSNTVGLTTGNSMWHVEKRAPIIPNGSVFVQRPNLDKLKYPIKKKNSFRSTVVGCSSPTVMLLLMTEWALLLYMPQQTPNALNWDRQP